MHSPWIAMARTRSEERLCSSGIFDLLPDEVRCRECKNGYPGRSIRVSRTIDGGVYRPRTEKVRCKIQQRPKVVDGRVSAYVRPRSEGWRAVAKAKERWEAARRGQLIRCRYFMRFPVLPENGSPRSLHTFWTVYSVSTSAEW